MGIDFDVLSTVTLESCIYSGFKFTSRMNSLRELFVNLSVGKQLLSTRHQLPLASSVRFYKYKEHEIPTPKPGTGKQYRRYVVSPIQIEYRLCEAPLTEYIFVKYSDWCTIPKTRNTQ